MTQKITFSTYPGLQAAFKERCELVHTSMTTQLESLSKDFLNGKLNDFESMKTDLQEKKLPSEQKTYKLTIQINSSLYAQLKEELAKSNTRPATFFSLAMAHFLTLKTPQDYINEARTLLNASGPEIKSIVYGLKYYKPVNGTPQLVHTEYFFDLCTAERFHSYYQEPHSPFLYVLALEK